MHDVVYISITPALLVLLCAAHSCEQHHSLWGVAAVVLGRNLVFVQVAGDSSSTFRERHHGILMLADGMSSLRSSDGDIQIDETPGWQFIVYSLA